MCIRDSVRNDEVVADLHHRVGRDIVGLGERQHLSLIHIFGHITGGHIETIDSGARSFQPMNVNFGLFPPLGARAARGTQKQALCARALADLDAWIGAAVPHAAE